jgi:acyl-CoA dehydrogenase
VDDDLARPEVRRKRLDRGTEWFRFRGGLICEVRAYHHGGPKNPRGDLLGFDHAARVHDAGGGARERDPRQRRAPILPPFGEEHEELRETVRRFVGKEIAPHVAEWEEAREFPRELYAAAASSASSAQVPESYGGQGGTHLHDAVWVEELSRSGGSGGVAAGLNAHTSIAMPPIFNFGTEEQQQRWLVPGSPARGSARWGSPSRRRLDVAGSRTFAEAVDGGYVVNGSKTFITNGVRADFLVCAFKTTEEGGHHGLSFLVLERDMPGYEVTRKLEKMGWHASDTGELAFTEVEVPEENLLGEENKGFHLIMANFQWERLSMALAAVGGMQRVFEVTLNYASEREAFGRPIGRFQVIRHKFAEMATRIGASRSLTYNALRLFVDGQDALREVTMAKLLTQRTMVEVADECLQIHGGYGYMREYGSSAPCATPASARSAAAPTRS